MKVKCFRMTLVVLSLFFAVTSDVHANEYLGDFCWQLNIPNGGIVKLGINHIGGQHYTLNGRRTQSDGYVMPATGNGEIVGNQLRAQLISTGYVSPEVFGLLGLMEIDLTTLNATLNGGGYSCDNGGQDCDFTTTGFATLTYIPCP